MDLRNKKLLMLGGAAYMKDVRRYADKKGFKIIDVRRSPSASTHLADEYFMIDTEDVESIIELVKEKDIDGIFVGSSEATVPTAITIAEKTGAGFYSNREQWDIISNKARFKEYARKFGVPVTKEYHVTSKLLAEDLEKIEYPVIVKPVDSSGARGMNACYNEEDLRKYYSEALRCSKSKEVIVEQLITEPKALEVFVHYTLQDGKYSLSCAFTKFKVLSEYKHHVSLPIFHMYPSSHIDNYISKVDEAAKKMFADMGLKNGNIMLQGFDIDGEFFFFESGYRLGGEQMYILTEHQNNVNSLELMINYLLTGSMADYDIAERDNAKFKWPCCNYYIPLKAGIITEVKGIEDVQKMDGVLNITKMFKIGDEIFDTNALERVCLRIHVFGKTPEKLATTLVNISSTLQVLDQNGNEMQIEYLEYDRCLNAIKNT